MGGSGAAPPPGAATAAAAAALEAQVRAAVAQTGGASDVEIVELRILRPYGLAFALVLRASAPASFMRHQLPDLLSRLRDSRSSLDGSYFALESAGGDRVWETAMGSRAGAGGVYTRPDLEGCNPIVHSQPPGYVVPPCPAP